MFRRKKWIQWQKCLDLYDEIHTLEMVWDTEIKIDPCNFSEGQMRRLDIMRNILKNSQILIFDEATANIDENEEGVFINYCMRYQGRKLLFFLRTIWKNCEKQILLWIWRSYI